MRLLLIILLLSSCEKKRNIGILSENEKKLIETLSIEEKVSFEHCNIQSEVEVGNVDRECIHIIISNRDYYSRRNGSGSTLGAAAAGVAAGYLLAPKSKGR